MFIDSFNDAQVSSDAAGRVLVLMQHFAALCRFPVIRPDDGFVVSARPKHRRRFAFDSGHEEAFVAVPDIGFDYSVVIHIFVSVDHPPNKALETIGVGRFIFIHKRFQVAGHRRSPMSQLGSLECRFTSRCV